MFMNLLHFIFLGFIQGFTEPIPVSSSGHLLIFQKLIGSENINFGLLATLTNIGSLVAIVLIFRSDVEDLIKDFFSYISKKDKKSFPNFRYCLYIVVGTIPAGIMGLVVTKFKIFDLLEENVKFVGFTLLITALLLFLIRDIKGEKQKKDISWKDALIVGLFQVVALIPGISRSGATIVGGISRKFTRKTAFKFSFILYIPISIATTLLGIKDLITSNLSFNLLVGYLISMLVAGFVTYFATKWFKNTMEKGKLIYFVWYCLIVGSLVIIFL